MATIKKQTPEQRQLIKDEIKLSNYELYEKIKIVDDCTMVTQKETGIVFTCVEVQLKGLLIDSGAFRKYLSYADIENYEVRN